MSEVSEDRDWESEARAGGWVPEPDGVPPEKRLDAKAFVERGEKMAGVMKSKVEKLESRVEQMARTNEELNKYHKETLQRERKKAEARIRELEAERAQAITDGDGQRFTKVDDEIQELKSQSFEPVSKEANNELAQAWLATNQWYANNEKLSAYADGIAEKVIAQGYTGQAYFNELTRRVKESFPEEFKNPNREVPSVETDTVRAKSDPKPRSYEALPKADRDQCDRFVKNIPGFTKEQFLAEYDWE